MLDIKILKLVKLLDNKWKPEIEAEEVLKDVIIEFLGEIGELLYREKINIAIVLELFSYDLLCALHFIPPHLRAQKEYRELLLYLISFDETFDEEQFIPDENGKREENMFDRFDYDIGTCIERFARALYKIGIATKKYNDNLLSELDS